MTLALMLVFVLSGAAGLIYEAVWTRYLGLFVGHDAYAQVLVLVIFLGGMALGAMAVGRRSARLGDPLVGYAAIEIVVGLIGLVFHDVYVAVTGAAYEAIFPALSGLGLQAVKWAIAGMLILPQSVLLGATFPLMSAGLLRRRPREPGRTLALLYFANSLGAAFGVLVAGFYLVATAGLPGTLVAAAILNLLAGLAAFAVARHGPAPVETATAAETPAEPAAPVLARPVVRLLLLTSFGTAVASFFYEIGWIRMLSLVLGSATHSFELMLSAFILGLALGALWMRSRADRFGAPLRALGVVQWGMGTLALATLPLYAASFDWMGALMQTFAPSEGGYTGFTLARYALCLAIMLPATFCAGMTLPLITKMLLSGGWGERSIGAVYGINTIGSIVGAAVAGLVLMPVLGVKGVLVAGAAVDMALGGWILLAAARTEPGARRLALAAAPAMVGAVAVALVAGRMDPMVLSSGVYRTGHVEPRSASELLYYRDGRTASVAVRRTVRDGFVTISTNGKPDASLDAVWFRPCDSVATPRPLRGDASTQALAPLITLAHAPRARRAAVIGHGSGMSSHVLLGSPLLEEVVTIEIEPAMIEGSRAFYPANRRVFDDPRSRFEIDDAKSYFAASGRRFDLIFSEPSNPWVSGVASLFTDEFYARIRGYLTEHGVFGQWMHFYEIDDDLVLSVLAALHRNFPAYEMFMTSGGDLLLVAGTRAALSAPDWSVTAYPGIAADLCRFLPLTPRTLDATRFGGRAAFAPLLDDLRGANSDFYPVLDLGAERARFLRRRASGFHGLYAGRFDFTAPFVGRRLSPGAASMPAIPELSRIRALAIGAAVRDSAAAPADSTPLGLAIGAAEYRRLMWDRTLEHGAPLSWGFWLEQLLATDRDLHDGTAGVADERFFLQADAFAARYRAPGEIRAGIAFLRGLRTWDFAQAADAADRLLPAVLARRLPLDPDEFRDGAVVAKLRVGATAEARRLLDTLAAVATRPPNDVRVRLLDAYVRAAERGAGAAEMVAAFR